MNTNGIRIVDNKPVFLDWAWSAVTHPFLSACLLLHDKKMPSELLSMRNHLIRVYLREWSDVSTEDHLQQLYDLVNNWRVVNYAVTDAEWVMSYLDKLAGCDVVIDSYVEWSLRQCQYQLVKTLRRVLALNDQLGTLRE